MQSMSKMNLSYRDQSDRVWSVMKTRQDNDKIDRTSAVHAKKDTELSWPIELAVVCNKIHTKDDVTDHTSAICIENDIELL